MKKPSFQKQAGAALLSAAALAVSFGAWAQAPLPQMKQQAGIDYLTGGIGRDESDAIKAASGTWPLTLEFAVADSPRAEFAADVTVVIRDAKGRVALEAKADGPYLLAGLAPGSYGVDATFNGKTLTRRVEVRKGAPTRATFAWPAGTGERKGS